MPNSSIHLTPNLLVTKSRILGYNSGILYNAGQACLIDPGIFPVEIDGLASFMKTKGIKPEVIVLTHACWDHIMGVTHFPNIKVIAQEDFLSKVEGEAGERKRQLIEEKKAEHHHISWPPLLIPKPNETFSESLSLKLGGITLQLLHTPGHTSEHLAIYVPEDGTLWAGDMLSDLEIPFIFQSLAAYEASLSNLASLEINALVPGHWTATKDAADIDSRIKADRDYLANLREQVSLAVSKGLSVNETVEVCIDFQHPRLDEHARAHQLNIESVYFELGGEGDPTEYGW